MKKHFLMTIKAEERPGLLHLITGIIEKRLVKIISLTSAPSNIHGHVLISIEVFDDESIIAQLALKLENIVEVFAVDVSRNDNSVCLRAAYFKLAKPFMESPKAVALLKHNATIVKFNPDSILVAKYGTDISIMKLYNDLDGPCLLGFSQTGLISDSKLLDDEEQSSVILKLAA